MIDEQKLVAVTDELHQRLLTQARNLLLEYRLSRDRTVPVDVVEKLMRLYGYLIAKLIFEEQKKNGPYPLLPSPAAARIDELNERINLLEHLLKMSQENEGFIAIDREKYRNDLLAAECVIEAAVATVNDVQQQIAKLTFTMSGMAFAEAVKAAWNSGAAFLRSVPQWHDQYLAKQNAKLEAETAARKETML